MAVFRESYIIEGRAEISMGSIMDVQTRRASNLRSPMPCKGSTRTQRRLQKDEERSGK